MQLIDVSLSTEVKGICRLVHDMTNQEKPDQGEKEKNTGRTVLKLGRGWRVFKL